MTDRYLNRARTAELWQRCKTEFGQAADAEEVSEMLDEVFGTPSKGQIAGDAEVEEMLKDVFGGGVKTEV